MLKDIIWPNHRRFKSRTEWEPIGFFSECLCNASQFDLMLGFFSSSAINVLSAGFSTFLYNNGKMRLIINDILTQQDKDAILKGGSDDNIPAYNITDIKSLQKVLSERDTHFFECLSWLIRENRLEIQIISPKDSTGIAHTKSGVFTDGENKVAFDGSCNFSRMALVENIESLTCSCSWDGDVDKNKIQAIEDEFNAVFNGKDDAVVYVDPEDVKVQILDSFRHKDLAQLLSDEYRILKKESFGTNLSSTIVTVLDKANQRVKEIIDKIEAERSANIVAEPIGYSKTVIPCFPYEQPHEYQITAFENWKNNRQKGLFAMATGTGKTITSLNCLLEIYKRNGYYKALILVPTIALVQQWEAECKKFKFENIIKVCSRERDWKSRVATVRLLDKVDAENCNSYIVIATYASYARQDVFQALNQFPANKLLLIADEAHNMGSPQMLANLSNIPYLRRIGLSATPNRQYDDFGNKRLREFFGCGEDYTFTYSMQEAIENGALCKYYYYPHIVRLTATEMADYVELSKRIVRIMSYKDSESQEMLKRLLLKRKRIIHKAVNKEEAFKEIVQNQMKLNGNLKYTLVYVPEGNKPDETADMFSDTDEMWDDEDSLHLINKYTQIVRDVDSHVVVRQFTSDSTDREEIISDFASGKIDVLTSMKCLDEGVDVPRSEFAIFCSSTGNPRQFIQRRGRVLRKHKDKDKATIHDLIVIPDNCFDPEGYALEKSLVEGELMRVRDFALLSENLDDTINALDDILVHYNLSIFK